MVGLKQDQKYDAKRIKEEHRDNALFVAFAPYEAPKAVVALILENAGGGSANAAPVVRAMPGCLPASRTAGQCRSGTHPMIRQDSNASLWQRFHIDIPLLLGLLALLLVSLVVLYSASGMHVDMLIRQLLRTGMAFGLMIFMAQLLLTLLLRPLGATGLCLVHSAAAVRHGVWPYRQGGATLAGSGFYQVPALRFLKLIMPMTIAGYLSRHALPPKFKHLIIALILVLFSHPADRRATRSGHRHPGGRFRYLRHLSGGN